VAGGRPPGAAEPIVGIFCLPGFVAERGPIRFSSGSRLYFFPHVRDRLSLSLSLSSSSSSSSRFLLSSLRLNIVILEHNVLIEIFL
jgi:hypothetical protein